MDEIVLYQDQQSVTPEQRELIKRTYCAGATDDEFALFMGVCERLGLSPLLGQIHFVKRWDNAQQREVGRAQVAIDGFRLVAERTGRYKGQTKPEWCDWEGNWYDVWLFQEPPAAARIGIWREGNKEPTVRVATLNSYCQRKRDGKPTAMWSKMPDVMLLKCAEAQALRVTFPNELGGVYTIDEMAQGERAPEDVPARPTVEHRTRRSAQPSNVVQLPAPRPSENEGIVQLFRAKLQARRKFDDLVQWCMDVRTGDYPRATRKVLWNMAQAHAAACGYDPLELAARVEELAAPAAESGV